MKITVRSPGVRIHVLPNGPRGVGHPGREEPLRVTRDESESEEGSCLPRGLRPEQERERDRTVKRQELLDYNTPFITTTN